MIKKCKGTDPSGEGGEELVTYDPGSELRLGGREKRRAKKINGTKQINKNKKNEGFSLNHFEEYA